MQFIKSLHEPIRAGQITISIRIWKYPRVKVGGKYRLGSEVGYVIVDEIKEIQQENLTNELAMVSGFDSVSDLMRVAQHGMGRRTFLIRFHYVDKYLDHSE